MAEGLNWIAHRNPQNTAVRRNTHGNESYCGAVGLTRQRGQRLRSAPAPSGESAALVAYVESVRRSAPGPERPRDEALKKLQIIVLIRATTRMLTMEIASALRTVLQSERNRRRKI
jgi:hypothetical protein